MLLIHVKFSSVSIFLRLQETSFKLCHLFLSVFSQYWPGLTNRSVVQYTNSSPQTFSSPDQRLTFDKIHLCLLEKIIKEVGFKIKTLSSPLCICYRESVMGFHRALAFTIFASILRNTCFLCLSFQRKDTYFLD